MKYIKEYSEYDSKQFTPEDVEELKDVYQDIVDDLGLYDNPFQILKVDDSTFQCYKSKMCKIFIRTIVSEYFGSEPSSEELNHHNHMLQLLEPHITRIKNMGYIIIVKDMLVRNPSLEKNLIISDLPSKGMVINGIEIHITKKPHQ